MMPENPNKKQRDGAAVPASYVPPCHLAGVPEGTPLVLGLSGGADSASLLHMLVRTGENVTVLHVNHCIRGAEADRDEAFCRGLCARYGVPMEVLRADVPAEAAKTGEGLEEAARRIRYAFFASVMLRREIPVLVTAHNADDQMETVLFDLTRGSGARGACGIPQVREIRADGVSAGKAVRPLLRLTKSEVLAYCTENGLDYVTDSTNADVAYARNRIRSRVIPELRLINPDAAGAFARFTRTLNEDCAYLDGEARRVLNDMRSADGGILPARLAALPGPIASRVVLFAARESGAGPEQRHVRQILEEAARGGSLAVTLPGGIIARSVRGGKLEFVKDLRQKKQRPRM